ncbi:hypothetical protein [Chengkuizengella axinellae]|uniref:HEPN domain-containing protein n=1 Tax=Chengkuizengella axinellae TaxID=3064388 RepID=A0ABT9J6S8_9BACL|nr:hypothetical protein [Chengkuizengella sp. 2205SS18-9]MDP5277172.1 hypothetical protein [Chengkuizengella sp. 2205SS18-9]
MKEVFSYNIDIRKNAYLNWRTSKHDEINNMIVLAEGFMTSAILLAEQVLNDNRDKKADSIIYPILFNVNHGIEVYLKSISWSLNKILNNSEKTFIKNHNLLELFNDVKTLVTIFEGDTNKKSSINMMESLENYITELYSKIENVTPKGKKIYNIDFSRYTLDYNGEPQFYINQFDNVVVDIENFVSLFEKIHSSLDGIAIQYLDYFEQLENNR